MQPSDISPVSRRQPLLERFKYVMYLLISVAIIAGVAVLLWKRPAPTTITIVPPEPTPIPSITPIPSSTPTPGPYAVYITGAVAEPEIVLTLPFGSRVLDAVQAAGGPRDDADLERVNMAQLLNDGDQVDVPTRKPGQAPAAKTATVIMMTPTPGAVTVYVTGEVVQTGSVVTLPAGSRVEEAIQLAGGTTDNADLQQINLSQVLNDGDLIYVPPLIGEAALTPTPNHSPVIHVNSATVEELDTLPGIGPALAQAIVDFRAENGPFASLEDLDNVSGIGPSKLEAIRDLVVFD